MKRTLVIGDIHGGLQALKQVLERADVSENDCLIFLGDYVGGWSESARVVDFIIDLSQKQNCIFIKGNHDLWCEDWLRTGNADSEWLFHGGRSTVEGYKTVDTTTRNRHLNLFEQMTDFHIDEKNRLFIHAGFTSMHGPRQEFYASNFSWDRTLWEMALAMDRRISNDSLLFPKRLKLFTEIYIGHTPTINYNVDVPMQGCNVWNIDTGAAFSGKLSIVDIGTKQFWQSDKVGRLYPGENGRNKL
ncbi:metallophosphoesterase family protein [Terrimonas pollutisoli]|uniref:metallophosphoesterase family protein n=1 Tax=Terrimonas pollutisoli TaxID=3034147 RepID=UPI0023EAF35C|nr:metallophosphoesterase family protein [Terrimonas sp. H1YJ31]